MRLNLEGLVDPAFQCAGYEMPGYDVAGLRARTLAGPRWVHFGAGNLFRAFIAASADRAIRAGALDCGIIAAASADTVDSTYAPFDNLCASVALNADGSADRQIVGCIAAALAPEREADMDVLRGAFRAPSLQLCSFTITEKGYDPSGAREASDLADGPRSPRSTLGQLCALMDERYRAGGAPIALVSMDNCARNGDRLKDALLKFAEKWQELGQVDGGFVSYLLDGGRVSYPCTMIDKITPRPDPKVAAMLAADGLLDMRIAVTARGGHTAPFVNAERAGYLVIEDDFPNGRPDLGACGFLMADRATVDRSERMKVCACLNPLHTALAVFGCLLGYERISAEMADADLVSLVRALGYGEGLPVVDDPGIIDPRAFLDTVLRERFPNPFMPDSPQRIATDTSQKLAIRFGETIKAHIARGDQRDLRAVPLALAGWLRYLAGIDDEGRAFERSPDPMLAALQPIADHLIASGAAFDEMVIAPLLRDARVFGVDLYEAGLADRVMGYLRKLLAGPGAVRATLREEMGRDDQ